MPRGKKGSTKVRTRVTTGTAAALLCLAASAVFAAAAFTKLDVKLGVVRPNNQPAKESTNPQQAAAKNGAKIPPNRVSAATGAQTSSLAMVLDSDTPMLGIVVAGTANVSMLKARFTAVGEAFTVKKLRIFNNDPSNDTGIGQIKLTYPNAIGELETKTGVLVNGILNIQDLNMRVEPNSPTILSISVDLVEVAGPDVSGDSPQLSIDYNDNFEAIGGNSATLLTSIGTDDVVGNQMVVHKTKPTITLSAESPISLNEVLRFNVTADVKGDFMLNQLGFKINATDNANTDWNTARKLTPSKFSLFDTTNLSEPLDCTWGEYGTPGFIEPGVNEDVGYVVCLFAQPKTIAAGTMKTYVMKMDASEASVNAHDTVRIDIPDARTGTSVVSVSWGEVGVGAMPYIDATGVRSLPIVGGTIHY